MVIARLIKEQRKPSAPDDDPHSEEIGILSFVELPRVGEMIGVQYRMDFVYLRVIRIRHFPTPHPFVLSASMPNTQQKEPLVHIIAE